MKKRILCLALALCLVAALLPVTALAEETTAEQPEVTFKYCKYGDTLNNGTLTLKPGDTKYFVTKKVLYYINDSRLKEENKHYFENRSAMTTSGATADNWQVMFTYPQGDVPTVTFRGARIEAPSGLVFNGPGDLKIKVLEDSSITTDSVFAGSTTSNLTTTNMNYAIYSDSVGKVTFEGPGKLTIKTPTVHRGIIYALGNLAFDNANIHLIDNSRNYLAKEASGNGNYGIYAAGNIAVNGGSFKFDFYNNDPAGTWPANIGTTQSLFAADGNLIIQDGAKIDAVITNAPKAATAAFRAGGDFTLGDCEMEIASAGIYAGYMFGKAPTLNLAEGKYTTIGATSASAYDAETDTLTPPENVAEYVADNATTYRYFKIEEVKAPPAFDKVQVVAGNDLTLNYRISKAEVEAAGGTQVKIERATAAGAAEPKFVPLTEATVEDGFYVIPFTGIAAKEMGDEIAMTVCNAEGEAVSVTRQDSILQYALRMLEGDDAKLKTLIVDMLNYGAMAQDVFDYNEENFVSTALTDEQKALGTQQMAACAANKATVTAAEGFTADVYQGTSFVLNNNIAMAMRMSAELGDGSYAKVTFTNYLNKDQEEVTVNAQKLTDGTYAYIYNGLVAADGRCMVTWEFYKADHTKVATVEDSMEQYVGRNVEALPYLAQLMNYSDAAYAYFTAE